MPQVQDLPGLLGRYRPRTGIRPFRRLPADPSPTPDEVTPSAACPAVGRLEFGVCRPFHAGSSRGPSVTIRNHKIRILRPAPCRPGTYICGRGSGPTIRASGIARTAFDQVAAALIAAGTGSDVVGRGGRERFHRSALHPTQQDPQSPTGPRHPASQCIGGVVMKRLKLGVVAFVLFSGAALLVGRLRREQQRSDRPRSGS